jgi:hypothetical protein
VANQTSPAVNRTNHTKPANNSMSLMNQTKPAKAAADLTECIATIQTGNWTFDAANASSPLSSGMGLRTDSYYVQFPQCFVLNPMVNLLITQIKANNNGPLAFKVKEYDVTPNGFGMMIMAWNDTVIQSFNVTWTANIQ